MEKYLFASLTHSDYTGCWDPGYQNQRSFSFGGIPVDQELLIRNGFVSVPVEKGFKPTEVYSPNAAIATIASNLATYGFMLDRNAFDALLVAENATKWWKATEK